MQNKQMQYNINAIHKYVNLYLI